MANFPSIGCEFGVVRKVGTARAEDRGRLGRGTRGSAEGTLEVRKEVGGFHGEELLFYIRWDRVPSFLEVLEGGFWLLTYSPAQ
jgi:hypothetical protein